MAYQDLFFDLDHTLWDFETNSREAMLDLYHQHQLAEKGVADFGAFFDRYTFHNHRLWDRYARGFLKQEELRWKRMWLSLLDFNLYNEALARAMGKDFLDILPHKNNLFPHAAEVLTYLREKEYRLHLITNGFESVQHHKLEKSGIAHFFEEVITSEGSNSLKPNKEIFEFALTKTGAQLSQSIMIGDNLEADIAGAMNVGMDTVFVNHVGASTELQPTFTITHLAQLENIF